MNKKLFLLLVILMSLSLIGIIFVQGYFIKTTVEDKEEQFSYNARQVLINVSKELQNEELEHFWMEFMDNSKENGKLDQGEIRKFFNANSIAQLHDKNDGLMPEEILEEDKKVSSDFLVYSRDSVEFSRLVSKTVSDVFDRDNRDGNDSTPEQRIEQLMQMRDVEKDVLKSYISEFTARIPIHKRLSEGELRRLITKELENYGLDSGFEYGVYSNGLATNVYSKNFSKENPATYSVPLFVDNAGNSNYQLLVNFTGKKKVVLSSVTFMAVLSIIFTLIIVIAYSSALSQLIKQRQISQIKTDFINNMTHEFKTPIATINLALDAIKNPKIINDQEKVSRYLKMIRDENKRMHAQVENVLQISKLDKNELDLKKERLHLHEIIEEAVTHVELIVEDRNGYIKTHFGALKSSILANEDHITNVVVNLLDNAIKYSDDKPKIDIYTENVRNFIVLKVRDQGPGMSKAVQKKIFEKFYREHTGNIHNVKGHGLGLAYAKRILVDHHGTITVESEKGKGSTFIIKLPLIT